MKILYRGFGLFVLIILVLVAMIDRTAPKQAKGYTVKVIFAGLPREEAARTLADNIITRFALVNPVITIAKDGDL